MCENILEESRINPWPGLSEELSARAFEISARHRVFEDPFVEKSIFAIIKGT